MQTLEEAKKVDSAYKKLLDTNDVTYTQLSIDKDNLQIIVDDILKRMKLND
jgi:hypothetical protein